MRSEEPGEGWRWRAESTSNFAFPTPDTGVTPPKFGAVGTA